MLSKVFNLQPSLNYIFQRLLKDIPYRYMNIWAGQHIAILRYRDHSLGGNWKHHRDCHIEPDWLLIYKIDGEDLYLVRTGKHSDLF